MVGGRREEAADAAAESVEVSERHGDDDEGEEEGEERFADAYDDVLVCEVSNSDVLAQSFEHADLTDDVAPVDLDANLVKHLLESFASQVHLHLFQSLLNLLLFMFQFFNRDSLEIYWHN